MEKRPYSKTDKQKNPLHITYELYLKTINYYLHKLSSENQHIEGGIFLVFNRINIYWYLEKNKNYE